MSTIQEKRQLVQLKLEKMIRPNPNKKPVQPKDATTTAPPKKDEEDKFDTNDLQKENLEIKPSSFGIRPIYSRVDINCDKWLVTLDEKSRERLENPPSLADGLSREIEQELRYLGCELIQQGAIMLKLPQTAAATGQILFQRFYYQKSFVKYFFEHAVMACLLLASKIEEEPRRGRDVYNVFHRLERLHRIQQSGHTISKETVRGMKVPMLDQVYVRAKNNMIMMERRILATLGFVVHVKHPHRLIIAYCHTLNLSNSRKDILQKAWNYMNDGLRTDIFMKYKPETIACACIFLAARTVDDPIALPSAPFQWFELFDTSDRDVQAISTQLLKLYSRKKIANWPRINAELDKLRDEANAKKNAEIAKKAASEMADRFAKMADEEKKENGNSRKTSPSRGEKEKEKDKRSRSDEKRRRDSPDRRGRDRRDRYGGDRDRNERRKHDGRDKERKRSRSRSRKDKNKSRAERSNRGGAEVFEKRRRESNSPPPKSRR